MKAARPRVVCHMVTSIDGLFDVGEIDEFAPRRLVLEAVERQLDDVLLLRYRVTNE